MERLGRYRILRTLGEGGMGVVYDALLEGPGGFTKPVALKVLKEGGAGLVHEARLGGLLRHRNLVEVYALEQIDGRWVCAMERVDGGSLRRRGALPPAAVVDVGRQVCAGLQHAHEHVGLVHLDLKPSNLLMDELTVKIADLGIARARGFATEARVRGTPAYMSPEQAEGRPVDRRSDLWSLGICLYELATGHRPSMDSGAAETWATVDVDDPVGRWMPAIDGLPWLAPVLARCLAEDPEDRFESAAELGRALAELGVDGPGLADALGVNTPMPASRRTTGGSTGTLSRRAPTQTNLGAEIDAFVGRQSELAQLDVVVGKHPLVVLKGTGGSGKTRLARQFGERWRRRTGGQSWFVDLAGARSRMEVLVAVAGVLKLTLGGESEHGLAMRIGHALAGRDQLLLILDNFEQVADCADLASGWSSASEAVRVVVTSRDGLGVGQVVELAPLPVEDGAALLIARARDKGREIADDPALDELVKRLDGLPLALELAAGRMGVMSPSQILERLDQRLKLLGGGRGRHGTLRATLDTSWELLGETERAALAQLSVCRGGFSAELAEELLEIDGWALDALDALVDRSLVVCRNRAEGLRFDLLESVRVYAAERLGDGTPDAELRHGRAMGGFGYQRDNPQSYGLTGWQRIESEFENLLVACTRAVARGDGPMAVSALLATSEVLELRGPYRLMRTLAEAVGALELDRGGRALVRLVEARVIRREGRARDALPGVIEARETFRDLSMPRYEADALNLHGNILRQSGAAPEALPLLAEAEALFGEIGDRRSQAMVWGNQAACHYVMGALDEARPLYQKALYTRRQMGDRRGEGFLLGSLAAVEQMAGRTQDARQHYTTALRLHRDVGDKRSEALCLGNLGVLEINRGQTDKAERRWLEAIELRRSIGDRSGMGPLMGYLAMLYVERGDLDKAQKASGQALHMHREVGRKRHAVSMVAQLGGIALMRGRLDDARALLSEAREGHVEVADRIGLGTTAVLWGRLCRAEGDVEGAFRSFDAAVDALEGRHVPSECTARAWRGWARASRGELEAAEADFDQALAGLRAGQYARGLAEVFALRALALGDRAALAEALSFDLPPGSPSGLLVAEATAALGESP